MGSEMCDVLPIMPPSLIHCRSAMVDDVSFIQATVRASWQTSFASFVPPQQLAFDLDREYGPEVLGKHLAHGPQHFYIIEDALTQEAKGFMALEHLDVEGLPTTTLHKLYFHPTFTGQGFGATTMAWLKKTALSHGSSQLALLVNRRNKAKGFYERHGFVVVGEVDTQIGQGPHGEAYWRNDYRMICAL